MAERSTDVKVSLAVELERAVRAADPRISGIESAEYVDSLSEAAIVTTTGLRSLSRDSSCYVATYAMATDGPADCTIKMSKSDLEDMIAGDLNPTAAFMQGKIKVEGDMSVAMQLSSLL